MTQNSICCTVLFLHFAEIQAKPNNLNLTAAKFKPTKAERIGGSLIGKKYIGGLRQNRLTAIRLGTLCSAKYFCLVMFTTNHKNLTF